MVWVQILNNDTSHYWACVKFAGDYIYTTVSDMKMTHGIAIADDTA